VKLGIAVLGTSHAHAAGKVEVLRASEEWTLMGACEPDEAVRGERSSQPAFRGLRWLTQEELLNDPEIVAAAVEGEVAENMPLAREVVRAGKHLHLEKPPGTSLADFRALVGAATDAGLVLQLGYMFRYNPAFRFAFEAQGQGLLGEVFFVRARMATRISAADRRRLAAYPGGMMFELGCHVLDAVIRLLGVPLEATGCAQHAARDDDALADNTLAVFRFERALAVVESAAMEVDPFPRRRFEVCGTEGSLVIEPLEPPALLASFTSPPTGHPAGWHPVAIPAYQRYVDDFRELAACVREGRPLSISPDHDLAVHAALLQACGVEA
jgi:predicted dehydrogenase